ncbi:MULTISPECIES: hypothetical protein [Streptomyces]|uniref:hypothetical protein n=1 Tax=Streptomyces TaxID=1883 RepID=UPI0013315759|nr:MULTISPECIES: hypothetical protein [Streptomyces]MZD52504.1 hypothetical protein [Streptomyces sp. SID5606]MZD58713.1 hypothetical protein [Streptomyces sp. SID5606]
MAGNVEQRRCRCSANVQMLPAPLATGDRWTGHHTNWPSHRPAPTPLLTTP